jgi:methionyl-tRNA synthetase
VDTVRYYCCSSAPYGSDLNFAEESLTAMHNYVHADVLGKLFNRVLYLKKKLFVGKFPDVPHDEAFPIPLNLQELKDVIIHDIDRCSIHTAIAKAMEAARNTNK